MQRKQDDTRAGPRVGPIQHGDTGLKLVAATARVSHLRVHATTRWLLNSYQHLAPGHAVQMTTAATSRRPSGNARWQQQRAHGRRHSAPTKATSHQTRRICIACPKPIATQSGWAMDHCSWLTGPRALYAKIGPSIGRGRACRSQISACPHHVRDGTTQGAHALQSSDQYSAEQQSRRRRGAG